MKGTTRALSTERTLQLRGPLQFMQILWALNHGLESASKRMAHRLGVTGPQRLVIRMIGRFPGVSAGELAVLLHSDPSTLTGVLTRLESRRLLVRTRAPLDARRMHFRLTSRGRSIDRITAGTIENAVRGALRHTAAADVAAASRLLRRISSQLARLSSPQAGAASEVPSAPGAPPRLRHSPTVGA